MRLIQSFLTTYWLWTVLVWAVGNHFSYDFFHMYLYINIDDVKFL
jgi:hypothetical protein